MEQKITDLLLIHPNDQKAVYGDTLKYTACEPPYWCAVAAQYGRERGIAVQISEGDICDGHKSVRVNPEDAGG